MYGTLSYIVGRRTGEMGLRMALGAKAGDIRLMILGYGGKLVGLGLLVGLCGSLALGQVLDSFLFELGPADPATLGSVILALFGAALLATYLPARRAARVDPIVALRSD